MDTTVKFDIGTHHSMAHTACAVACNGWLEDEQFALDHRGWGKQSMQRQDKCNCANGAWLTVVPNWLNGTGLSADKWRDLSRLRYNYKPQGMQDHFDG